MVILRKKKKPIITATQPVEEAFSAQTISPTLTGAGATVPIPAPVKKIRLSTGEISGETREEKFARLNPGSIDPVTSIRAPEAPTAIESAGDVFDTGKAETGVAEDDLTLEELRDLTPDQIRARQVAEAEKRGLAPPPSGKQEVVEKLKEEQTAQTKFALEQETRIKELEDLGLSKIAERLRRSVGAATSAFGTRQGVISTATQALPGLVSAGGEKILNEVKLRITNERARRVELERRRDLAQQNQQSALASDLEAEIRSSKIKEKTVLAKAEADLLRIESAVQTAAETKAQNQLDFISDLPPEAFANIPATDLGRIFEAAGLSPSLGLALKQANADLVEAKKTKDELAISQAQATLDNTIAEGKQIGVEKATKAEQSFEARRDLVERGASAEELERFDVLTGFDDAKRDAEINLKNAQKDLADAKAKAEGVGVGVTGVTNIKSYLGGDITAVFGEKTDVEPEGHTGMDFAAINGTDAPAITAGVVTNISTLKTGLGNSVTIRDTETSNKITYGHLSSIGVAEGDTISKDQIIGQVGNTGSVLDRAGNPISEADKLANPNRGSHLHIEAKDSKGNRFDPERLFIDKEAQRRQGAKFLNIKLGLPVKLVDSVQEQDALKEVVDSFPELTSTEIKRLFIIGEEIDDLPQNTRNVAEQLVDIGSGITKSGFDLSSIIGQAKRGNFISAINTVENQRLEEQVTEGFTSTNVERNIFNIQEALEHIENNPEDVGKIDAGVFRLEKKAGLNNAQVQRIESLLTWMIAPVRNQIAGSDVTEPESIFLDPIIPDISNPQENLQAKLEVLRDAYLRGYNTERRNAGLIQVDINDIINPLEKVKKYEQGITLQQQLGGVQKVTEENAPTLSKFGVQIPQTTQTQTGAGITLTNDNLIDNN